MYASEEKKLLHNIILYIFLLLPLSQISTIFSMPFLRQLVYPKIIVSILDTGPHWKLKNRRLCHYTNNTVSK
jgi:hypothetical protein